MKEFSFAKLLKGSKVTSIKRTCDLIMISFESSEMKEICLHVQKALFRMIESEKLIVSSWDMYIPGKIFVKKLFKRFKWDISGNTLYDDEIKEHEKSFLNANIGEVIFNGKDLLLKLENGLRIEILVDTLETEHEIYRIFERGDLESHYVVES